MQKEPGFKDPLLFIFQIHYVETGGLSTVSRDREQL